MRDRLDSRANPAPQGCLVGGARRRGQEHVPPSRHKASNSMSQPLVSKNACSVERKSKVICQIFPTYLLVWVTTSPVMTRRCNSSHTMMILSRWDAWFGLAAMAERPRRVHMAQRRRHHITVTSFRIPADQPSVQCSPTVARQRRIPNHCPTIPARIFFGCVTSDFPVGPVLQCLFIHWRGWEALGVSTLTSAK
jgi:hypothetical protein